jgi:hypothetical protein
MAATDDGTVWIAAVVDQVTETCRWFASSTAASRRCRAMSTTGIPRACRAALPHRWPSVQPVLTRRSGLAYELDMDARGASLECWCGAGRRPIRRRSCSPSTRGTSSRQRCCSIGRCGWGWSCLWACRGCGSQIVAATQTDAADAGAPGLPEAAAPSTCEGSGRRATGIALSTRQTCPPACSRDGRCLTPRCATRRPRRHAVQPRDGGAPGWVARGTTYDTAPCRPCTTTSHSTPPTARRARR